MSEKEDEVFQEEIYYGVIIPFDTKEQARFVKAEVKRVLGYGGWIRIGVHDGDD